MIVHNEPHDQSAEQWMLWNAIGLSDDAEECLWSVRLACPHLLGWSHMHRALRDNP